MKTTALAILVSLLTLTAIAQEKKAEPSAHGTDARHPVAGKSFTARLLACRAALVSVGIIADLNDTDRDGGFFVPGTNPGQPTLYVFRKQESKPVAQKIDAKQVQAYRQGTADLGGGNRLLFGRNGSNAELFVGRRLCDKESVPSAAPLTAEAIPDADAQMRKAAMRYLDAALNDGLYLPMTFADAPENAARLKQHGKAFLDALEHCHPLADGAPEAERTVRAMKEQATLLAKFLAG